MGSEGEPHCLARLCPPRGGWSRWWGEDAASWKPHKLSLTRCDHRVPRAPYLPQPDLRLGQPREGAHGCCARRLQAALKKYQTEQRSRGDALDKCQAELKKLRKKSQGSKNPQKYSDKELQVGRRACGGDGGDPLLTGPRVPFSGQ